MIKIICLIKGVAGENHLQFKERIFSLLNRIDKNNVALLKVVLTEDKPPVIAVIPFKKKKVAAISMQLPKNSDLKEFIQEKGFVGYYQTTEALPVSYTKNWEDKTVTPGVCLLTLFNQKKGISPETFINRWHNGHTPLSLKIHPLTHYNRNVVNRQGTENVELWDGIVEEHTKTKSDLLNPFKFFGGPLKMIPNMIAVYFDTKSFLDYATIETYLTQEYILKS